jgi:hypothetical protein
MITNAQMDNWFTYHAPRPGQAEKYQHIRTAAKILADTIQKNTPEGADQVMAVRKVREAMMTANAAIACEPAKE